MLGLGLRLGNKKPLLSTGVSEPYGRHTRWRIYVTKNQDGLGYTALDNIQMHAHANGGDQCVGGTADQDSVYIGGSEGDKSFNDDFSGGWISGNGNPHWVEYQFSSAVSVAHVSWLPRNGYPGQAPEDFEIQYHDGSTWQTAWSVTGHTGSANRILDSFTSPDFVGSPPAREFSYWGLQGITPGTSGAGEIEFRATIGGADQCSGGTANAVGTYPGYNASAAFNNDGSTTGWVGFGSKWRVWYEFAEAVRVAQMMLQAENVPGNTFTGFWIIASDNGTDWNVIKGVTGESAWSASEQRTYTV